MNSHGTTQQPEADAAGQIPRTACPLLGLRDDPATHALYPRDDHQCGVAGVGAPSLEQQAGYCLSTRHAQCPHFVKRTAAPGDHGQMESRKSGRSRRLIVTTILVGLTALLGTGVVLAVVVGMATPGSSTSTVTSTSDRSGGMPSTQPLPTPAPAMPTPESTLVPSTNSPSPAAAATEPPARHTVAPGETLGEIAERYDTTVAELVRINQIDDAGNIPVGMVLQLRAAEPEPESGAP
ncbi:LysM peptidoglycan-binding domain-containing protein [Nitrolancea hollandica]|uniref:LysM domain-containing protein n=1 Tax=Nitrolancea hollandica Lb TaxID=1129897 RepID=I4EI00_9BACT|nr:LysM domain-containing protein [Nitrolancea hollandica]CCF84312.1 hypothetical protein NITHO_3310029 [Nitrolancea hollandica Lb]